jgi:protein CpxP
MVLCGLMVSVATAQDTKAPPRRGGANVEQRIERLDKEVTLTADQKAKLKTYFEAEAKKRQALREDTSLTREQKREKARAIGSDLQKEMKSILTSEQYAKWEKAVANMRDQARQKGKGQAKQAEKAAEKAEK